MPTDYYQLLGVTKSATKDDIKKAYRKQALATHPDRAPADKKTQAEEAFRNVNAAYEILSNDETRALYDMHGVWPPPQDLPSRAKSSSRSHHSRPAQPGFYEVPPQPASSYHHFVFTDPRALFEAIFEEFKNIQNQMHAHVQAAKAIHSDAFVPYAPPPAGIFPPQYPSVPSFPTSQVPQSQPFTSSGSRTEHMSTNGLWIKESKVIKLTSSGQREVTLKRTDVDGTVYITRQAGDGTRRYFVQKDGIERPTDEKTPDVPPSSKSQSQSTRQSSSSRYSHTASASQPANFPPYAAPQPQTSANPATTAPRRSSPTYRVASPSPMDRASRSAERPPQPSASAQYPATAQPVPRRALSPVAGDRELRRNHTLPSMHSSAAAREPMPRPQSPHFYERSRTGSDALRMKTPTKMNPSYKPAIGPYESQPSSAATSRASSVEPGTNSTNEYGYTSSSRSKPTKSHSQPAAQPTSAPLSGSSRQRSSDHVSSVPSSATSAQFPAHAQMAKPQVQAPVPKMQQPPPPSYVQPPQMRSSSQQPTRPSHAAPQPAPQAVPQPVPKYPTSHSTTQGSSSRVSSNRAPSSRVTNGLGLGDVPPPPPTGSITGQSRAQEYLSRHQQQPMPVPRTTSYEYMAQPPPMMYTTAGPVPMHPQMNPAAAHYPHASAGAPHHQDYRAGRRMQHA